MAIEQYPNPRALTPAEMSAAIATLDPWHNVGDPGEPAFLSNWVNYDWPTGSNARCKFRKVAGVVYVQGLVKGGTMTADAPFFQLPGGYRPDGNFHLAQAFNGGTWMMRVNGHYGWDSVRVGRIEVAANLTANVWVDVSCSFVAGG